MAKLEDDVSHPYDELKIPTPLARMEVVLVGGGGAEGWTKGQSTLAKALPQSTPLLISQNCNARRASCLQKQDSCINRCAMFNFLLCQMNINTTSVKQWHPSNIAGIANESHPKSL